MTWQAGVILFVGWVALGFGLLWLMLTRDRLIDRRFDTNPESEKRRATAIAGDIGRISIMLVDFAAKAVLGLNILILPVMLIRGGITRSFALQALLAALIASAVLLWSGRLLKALGYE